MGEPVKFDFAREFDRREGDRRTGGRRAEDMAQMDAARAADDLIRKEAFEAGRAAGRMEAESDAAAAIARLGSMLSDALAAADGQLETIRTDAAELALAAALKLHVPDETMAARLTPLFADAAPQPHIRVRVPENAVEAAKAAAAQAAARSDYAGRISVEGVPGLAQGDLAVDWGTGGLVDTRAARLAALTHAIENQFPMETTNG